MSDLPLVGTFLIDGMLQGPLPPDTDVVDDFETWVGSAKSKGLHLHLRVEGGSYSLVADPAIRKISTLNGDDLESLFTEVLQSLLDLLPLEIRVRAFSTLRSEEFRPGAAAQTLYAVGPDGEIQTEQRMVNVETGHAAPGITRASLRRIGLPALVALLLVLLVSIFFVDSRQLIGAARDRITPLKKDELVVRHEVATDILTLELIEVDRRKNTLVFRLSRGPGWSAAVEAGPADAMSMDWPEFITLLAIRHGRLRIALLDKDDRLLVSQEIDVRGLQERESIRIELVANPRDRIATVILQP